MKAQYAEELYKVSLDLDVKDGTIKQLKKANEDLSEKNALYQKDTIKLYTQVQTANRKKFLAVEKERMNGLRILEEEKERGKQAMNREIEIREAEIEKEKRDARRAISQERERYREEKEKGKQTVVWERENTNAWKRRAQENKNRFCEMQNLYVSTSETLKQCQAQNALLEHKVEDLDRSLEKYVARNGFLELQLSQQENASLQARIGELEAKVQDYLGRLVVLEGAAQGGDNYWLRRLRDATRMIQDRDDYNTTLMVQVQEVAQYVKNLAAEAEALTPFVAQDMKEAARFVQLLKAIQDLGTRADAYL